MMAGLGEIVALLLLASPEASSLAVVRSLDRPDLVREGIAADVIGLPPALDVGDFAAQVVEAEHLTAWNNGPMTEGEATAQLRYRAMTAGDGRSVVVYYSSDPAGPRAVCRLRTTQTGPSEARYRALRWCALQVGVLIPDEPAPPVGRRGRR